MSAQAPEQNVIHIIDSELSAASKGMHLSEIRAAMPELEAACNAAIERNEIFSDLCKLVGLKANTDPGALKTFVTAKCKNAMEKTEQKAEQISILFDELGDQ